MRDYHYDDVDVKNDHRYSWRKRYQRGYGEESASPALKKILDSRKKRPYMIEPSVTPEDRAIIEKLSTPPVTFEDRAIKRSRTTPLTKEEIEWRHKELRKIHKDKPTGRIINWWRDLKGHYE